MQAHINRNIPIGTPSPVRVAWLLLLDGASVVPPIILGFLFEKYDIRCFTILDESIRRRRHVTYVRMPLRACVRAFN